MSTAPTTTLEDEPILVPAGLRGVAVCDTEVSDVRGRQGFFHYRQHDATELAATRSFEDVWALLVDGRLPSGAASTAFAEEVRSLRRIPDDLLALLPGVAALPAGGSLDRLRSAVSLLGCSLGLQPLWDLGPEERRGDLLRLVAATPTLVAALHRLAAGRDPIDPDPELDHAANYLWMLTGERSGLEQVRAVEQYLILTMDHGFNNSTFASRVIASSGADAAAALTGAIGSLSGPLHGSAPGRALEALEAIGTPEAAPGWVRSAIERGDRIMGFGHAVYTGHDPRSEMLRGVAEGLGGDLVALAVQVEALIEATLAELKPDRTLRANVEYYAGVVMRTCGLPAELFSPSFAVSRTVGWSANVLEQLQGRRIIRPVARYVGEAPPVPVPAPTGGRAG